MIWSTVCRFCFISENPFQAFSLAEILSLSVDQLKGVRSKYSDFGPTLACEYLAKEDALNVGVETLRQWLIGEGLWSSRRRRPVHRKWRERKGHFGEMVQLDGSHHDWFEGRRENAVLMVLIDDATNRTYARFFERRDDGGVVRDAPAVCGAVWFAAFGVCGSRRRSTGRPGMRRWMKIWRMKPPETQFGRAMKELDVELILAHSPQAKGRVERRNAVFQDRLVKALRLKGISDLEGANAFLDDEFLTDLNEKFNVPARAQSDLHRRVPRCVKLERVLSFQEERVVQNDWTIRWRNRWFQLTKENQKLALVQRKLTVCEQLDGTVLLLLGKRVLSWEEFAGASCASRRGAVSRGVSKKFGHTPETLGKASVAKALQAVSGEGRGIGSSRDKGK